VRRKISAVRPLDLHRRRRARAKDAEFAAVVTAAAMSDSELSEAPAPLSPDESPDSPPDSPASPAPADSGDTRATADADSGFIVSYGKTHYVPPRSAVVFGEESEVVPLQSAEHLAKVIGSKAKTQWAPVCWNNVVILEHDGEQTMYARLEVDDAYHDAKILRPMPQQVAAEKVARWVADDAFDVSEYPVLFAFRQAEKHQINPKASGWNQLANAPMSVLGPKRKEKAKAKPEAPKRKRAASESDDDVSDEPESLPSEEISDSNTPSEAGSDSESVEIQPPRPPGRLAPAPAPVAPALPPVQLPAQLNGYAILIPLDQLGKLMAPAR
jgi:hypothetical protein